MSEPYTPTTEEIREYIQASERVTAHAFAPDAPTVVDAFDRWLAAHDAALIAEHERLLAEQAASQEWQYGYKSSDAGYVWVTSEEAARDVERAERAFCDAYGWTHPAPSGWMKGIRAALSAVHPEAQTTTNGDAMTDQERRTITIDLDTGDWASGGAITGDEGARVAASVLPGTDAELVSGWYSAWMSDDHPATEIPGFEGTSASLDGLKIRKDS